MKTFTVRCDYPPIYRAEITVEAEEAFKRCLIGKLRLPAPDQQSRYDITVRPKSRYRPVERSTPRGDLQTALTVCERTFQPALMRRRAWWALSSFKLGGETP